MSIIPIKDRYQIIFLEIINFAKFNNKITFTSGITGSYTNVESQLYGDHYSNNLASYVQGDKWDKVTFYIMDWNILK